MSAKNVSTPFDKYADDHKDRDNYVRVTLIIDGLQKATFTRPRLAQPANGTVDLKTEESSLRFTATLKDGNEEKSWEYVVKQLPEPIHTDRDKTYWKIKEDGKVVLMLRKLKPGTWVQYLGASGKGLDQA